MTLSDILEKFLRSWLTESLHNLIHGVQRLATSAYKPARLGKSLLLGLSRRSGQTYPLVAAQVDLQPFKKHLQSL